ncbi:hypothetical protein [Yoonia vestfoldensis]|uniref:hypothetical protein n=1 Tax=Yoonia vestfoldensis TaxID=245188 RepID=UPI00036483AF|nr:hypothetical protein [Yoonia vestfoldensis]
MEPAAGQVIYGINGRDRYAFAPLDDAALFDIGADPDRILCAVLLPDAGLIQPQDLGALPIVDAELMLAHFCATTFGDAIGHNITCRSCQKKYGVEFSLSTYAGLLAAEVVPHRLPDFRGHPLRLPSRDLVRTTSPTAEGLARAVWQKQGVIAAEELQALEAYLEKSCPVLQEDITSPCPACQTEQSFRFVLRDWVVMKLRSRLKQVLMQVHLLATAYHWRTADIFALSRANRMALIDTMRSHAAR